MLRYALMVTAAAVAVGSFLMYVKARDAENVQKGISIQRAENIATINQTIAERRVRDAQFDKMDVKQLCTSAGLDWVFDAATQRSRCQ